MNLPNDSDHMAFLHSLDIDGIRWEWRGGVTCSEHTQLFSLDSRQVRQIVQNAIDSSVYEREFTAHAREAEARERELRVQRGIAARAREIEMRERGAETRARGAGTRTHIRQWKRARRGEEPREKPSERTIIEINSEESDETAATASSDDSDSTSSSDEVLASIHQESQMLNDHYTNFPGMFDNRSFPPFSSSANRPNTEIEHYDASSSSSPSSPVLDRRRPFLKRAKRRSDSEPSVEEIEESEDEPINLVDDSTESSEELSTQSEPTTADIVDIVDTVDTETESHVCNKHDTLQCLLSRSTHLCYSLPLRTNWWNRAPPSTSPSTASPNRRRTRGSAPSTAWLWDAPGQCSRHCKRSTPQTVSECPPQSPGQAPRQHAKCPFRTSCRNSQRGREAHTCSSRS